jgi:hypothetical protein
LVFTKLPLNAWRWSAGSIFICKYFDWEMSFFVGRCHCFLFVHSVRSFYTICDRCVWFLDRLSVKKSYY